MRRPDLGDAVWPSLRPNIGIYSELLMPECFVNATRLLRVQLLADSLPECVLQHLCEPLQRGRMHEASHGAPFL